MILPGLTAKIDAALARLDAFRDPDGAPYWLAYSGGKDSTVLLWLAQRAGVPFDAHYNLTTVDPPELVRFIKQQPVIIEQPPESMWELILRMRYPPDRRKRFCCEVLKERGGAGRRVLTGIRWEESHRRARRQVEDRVASLQKIIVNPIIDWSEWDVWGLIRGEGLPYCSLYDEGFLRLGCICCPQQGGQGMRRDAARWPGYRRAYVRTFDRVISDRRQRGLRCTWTDGEALFRWWCEQPEDGDQECFVFE